MNRAAFIEKYCAGFDGQQLEAVCAEDAHILLLAVPGNGKTTVMVTRVAYRILCLGADPVQMLTFTFSRAAADEMRALFATRFGADCGQIPLFCTINSLCYRIVDACCAWYGLEKPTLVEHRRELLREAYIRCFPDAGGPSPAMEGALDGAVGYSKNMAFTRVQRLRHNPDETCAPRTFNAVFEALVSLMRERNLIDFDD